MLNGQCEDQSWLVEICSVDLIMYETRGHTDMQEIDHAFQHFMPLGRS